jgi:trimeric autotransporter adhesin
MPGCGSTSSAVVPPPNVTVAIQPASANLFLGQTEQFQATVTGTANTNVSWAAGGVAGGSATAGTISVTGLYTAPGVLPAIANVTVTASSIADPQATASSIVTLKDDIAVSISPTSATVANSSSQSFVATLTGSGSPSTAVTWNVNGVAGGNPILGTIISSGGTSAQYTAPSAPPSPAIVQLSVVSVADASKSASASVTVTCSATNSISPATATVDLAQTQNFTASFCVAADDSILWDVNGIAGGNSAIGTIAPSSASGAVYSAPSVMPSPAALTIHAKDGTASGATAATASVTLASNISVTVAPTSSTLLLSQRMPVSASLTNTSDLSVRWLVNGILNGTVAVGQICQSGSNPCIPPLNASSGSVDYLAPASLPATDPVVLTAVSQADPSKSGTATVAVTTPVSIAIAPLYAFVPPPLGTPSTSQFFATVTGTTNANVTWSVQTGVPGQGCGGSACGSVDANGLYTAPAVAPNPNAISIVATSVADATKSSAAAIAITSGPVIETILPSSVMAGAVESFPLTVEGANFVPGSGNTGGVILINGGARATTCQATTTSCTTVLNPSDLQSAATITLQLENPGMPPQFSNPVPFIIVPFDVSEDVITLNASQSSAPARDVTVVEPTTAASSAAIDVDFDGFLTSGTCEVEGTPITVTRPLTGSAITRLCIHGNGLEPTFTYEFTGPGTAPGDIRVAASTVTGLFSNTIELDVEVSSTTLPGVRSLFISTLNNDLAVATGILEVK